MTSGVHMLHYTLDHATSVEPRAALRFQVHPSKAITFGVGLHSRTESIMTYQAQVTDEQGRVVRPNEDLGLTKAAHAVLGYEQMLAEDIQFKAEAYYQHQYGVPVENDVNSSFSLGNWSEWFTTRTLVNKGVGRTMGVEASLEKYYTRGYHFMLTGSVSDARYKPLDGNWYNSRYNMGVVANALAGKEWKLGAATKDHVLSTGFRYSVIGGQYQTPIDLEASIAAGEQVETGRPWSVKGDPIHKLDIVVSYRVGRPKASHEFKLDVQNVLNASTRVYSYYDAQTRTVQGVPQLGLLPVLQYTMRF
jgi:outer membrane receptor protein involved in Fe transport